MAARRKTVSVIIFFEWCQELESPKRARIHHDTCEVIRAAEITRTRVGRQLAMVSTTTVMAGQKGGRRLPKRGRLLRRRNHYAPFISSSRLYLRYLPPWNEQSSRSVNRAVETASIGPRGNLAVGTAAKQIRWLRKTAFFPKPPNDQRPRLHQPH